MPDKDPRRPEFRALDEKFEDVGVFDDLDFEDFFRKLNEDHGIHLGKEAAILEIGSGRGGLLQKLQRAGYFVVGVEPRVRQEHKTGELSILHQRVEELSNAHNSKYDLVIADSAIDPKIYTHSPEEVLRSVFRVLKPGGIFLYGLKGESALPELAKRLGATHLEIREEGYSKAYVFQKNPA